MLDSGPRVDPAIETQRGNIVAHDDRYLSPKRIDKHLKDYTLKISIKLAVY